MSLKIFILEDEIDRLPRSALLDVLRRHELVVAQSKDEGIAKYPSKAPYDLILLDHDMEGNYEYRPNYPNTGMEFVKWLVKQDAKVKPSLIIHSYNTVGANNMRQLLEDYNWHVVYFPFGIKYLKFLEDHFGGMD